MNYLLFLALLALVGCADAACCKSDIVKETSRSLFNPPLRSCPSRTTFVCSASNNNDLKNEANMIIINGKTAIAASKAGKTATAELQCMGENWQTSAGKVVNSIACHH